MGNNQHDNTNRGALFGNTRQREGKKDPDLQGKIDIAGVEHWISGWFFFYEKEGVRKKAISLALGDEVEKRSENPSSASKKSGGNTDDEDSIPF